MTKYLMETGEVIDAAKDCDCLFHENIPHWIYEDELWRERNSLKLDGCKHFEYEKEEKWRLMYKAWFMKMNGIVEIFDDCDVI